MIHFVINCFLINQVTIFRNNSLEADLAGKTVVSTVVISSMCKIWKILPYSKAYIDNWKRRIGDAILQTNHQTKKAVNNNPPTYPRNGLQGSELALTGVEAFSQLSFRIWRSQNILQAILLSLRLIDIRPESASALNWWWKFTLITSTQRTTTHTHTPKKGNADAKGEGEQSPGAQEYFPLRHCMIN